MVAGTDERTLIGVGLKLASVAVLMGMAVIVKAVSSEAPPGEIVFFRSLFAVPPILLWLWWRGDLPGGLATRRPVAHLWRGIVGTVAMALMFTGLGLLPLPEVTAISYAAPVLVTVFAALFLGERIRIWRLTAVAIGFLGVLVMLWPKIAGSAAAPSTGTAMGAAMGAGMGAGTGAGTGTGEAETLGAAVMLSCAVLMAAATCLVRRMVQTEESAAIVFWFSLSATGLSLLSWPLLALVPGAEALAWRLPSPGTAALLVLAGIAGGIGQILLTESYRHGDAAVIAPFEYASILLSLAIGWFVFAEAPGPETVVGAGMVIAAGLVILWREQAVKRVARGPGPVPSGT